ncbi:MAG: carbohydrate-binding family V/XII, partial [Bacteroidota bacterium]
MRRLAAFFLLFWITPLYATAQEAGEELTWPRELQTERARIILYQPQLESFAGNILEGRMALALQPEGKDLTFGALWFKGHMSTDLDERLVYLERVEIPNVRFPDLDSSDVEELKAFVIAEVESWEIELSLDRLLASMESEGGVGGLSQNLNNDPPDIYFRTNSAILVSIDGEPILNDVENSNLKYVVNTPYFIVQNPGDGRYYIKGGKFWFTSGEITKGWVETKEVPRDIQDLATQVIEEPEEGADSVMAAMDTAPEIIVATRSSELIITDGEPDYASIEGTSLLYVNNSESDIIMDINTQQHYVLLAGRWFKSGTLKDGEWTFEEPGDLPEDFARIPESSDIATVRTSVPGTDEARDAVLEQSIPQTAAVDRKTATVSVQYDGNPKFERVSGTDVAYAANADKTVMLINDKYYCVDDGIWFESQKAMGPWEVSVQRPDEVDDLPPDSPVYNVKYVYVYDYTPEVVYVGYTPGYTWSYVYGGVVVYGTGFYYHPWYAHYYYPRPV